MKQICPDFRIRERTQWGVSSQADPRRTQIHYRQVLSKFKAMAR